MSANPADSSQVLNSLPGGVVVRDAETYSIEWVNNSFCEMVGAERQELVGSDIDRVDAGPLAGEDDTPEELIERAQTEGSITFERQMRAQTGECFPVEVHLSFLADEGNLMTTIREIRARKDRQQRLRRYERFVEQAPEMMLGLEPDGTLSFANAEFRRRYDVGEQSVAGLAVEDVLSAERNETLQPVLDRVFAGDSVDQVLQETTQQGDERWYRVRSYPLDQHGERDDSVGVVIDDVTDQERNKQAVRDQQAFIESSFDALDDVFYVVDTEEGLVEYNERLLEVTGYDPEALLDMQPWEFFILDERPDIKHAIANVLHNESEERVEGHFLTSSGELVPHEFSAAPYYDSAGEVAGFVGIGRDITERKERGQDLTRFKQAIEQTGHAVCFTDTDGTIEYVNSAFEDLTEYSRDEARGETPSILKSGEHGDEYYQDLWETITAGQVWEGTTIDQRKSGTQYRAYQTIAPVSHEGSTLGFISIQNEITDKRLRKEHISVLHRILRHNLRNALNVIHGYAEKLLQSVDGDTQRDHVRKITEEVEQLESLGTKIQRAKNTIEQLSPPFNTVPVSGLYEDVVTSLGVEASDATMTLECPSEEPVYVAERLKPALKELLENARRHTEETAPSIAVQVCCDAETERVSLTVTDDGRGIPETVVKTLQEGQETDLQHLNGVGLWLVKWIVTALGGTLNIEAANGTGSQITLTTPLEPSRPVDEQ
jgi:PAS domain S-box-containing protein